MKWDQMKMKMSQVWHMSTAFTFYHDIAAASRGEWGNDYDGTQGERYQKKKAACATAPAAARVHAPP